MNILTPAMNPAQRHKVPKSRLLARKIRGPRVAIHPHSSACSDTNKQHLQQDNRSSIPPTAFWDQSVESSDGVRRPSSQHLSSLTEDTFVPARIIDISELEEVMSCPIAVATTVDTLDEHHDEENDEENGADHETANTSNSHSTSKSSFQVMVYTSYAIVALAFICFVVAVAVVFSNRESGDDSKPVDTMVTNPTEVVPTSPSSPSATDPTEVPPAVEERTPYILQAEYVVIPNGCALNAGTFMDDAGSSMRQEVEDMTTSITKNILYESREEEDVRRRKLAYIDDQHPISIKEVIDQDQGLFVSSHIPVMFEPGDNPDSIIDLIREGIKGGFEVQCDFKVKQRLRQRTRPPQSQRPSSLRVQVGYTLSNDCGLNAEDIMNGTDTNMKQDLIKATEAVVKSILDETFPQDDIQLIEQDPVTIDQVLNVEVGCEEGVNCLYISSTISVENYGDEPAIVIDTIERGMQESFEEFTFFDELSDDTLECLLEDDDMEQILEDDSEGGMFCTADDPTCPQGLHCRLHEGEGCIESAIGVCVEPPSPRCPRIYRLVCGCDGIEYSNSCLAYHGQAANGAFFSGYTMGGC